MPFGAIEALRVGSARPGKEGRRCPICKGAKGKKVKVYVRKKKKLGKHYFTTPTMKYQACGRCSGKGVI